MLFKKVKIFCSFFISFEDKWFVIKQKEGNYYATVNKEVTLKSDFLSIEKIYFLNY